MRAGMATQLALGLGDADVSAPGKELAIKSSDLVAGAPADSGGLNQVGAPQEYRGWRGNGRGWSSLGDFLGMFGTEAAFRQVNMRDALAQAAIMACLDVKAQDTGKAEIRLKKRVRAAGGRASSVVMMPEEHPAAELFWMRPNKWMTWPELVEMTVYHLGLVNNAYWIPRGPLSGGVQALVPALPGRVFKDAWPERGEFVYRLLPDTVGEEVMFGTRNEIILFESEICHFATRRMNGVSGAPTLAIAQRTLAISDALQRFQNKVFASGGQAKGVFEMPPGTEMSQPQYDRLVSGFKRALELMSEENFPLVLEGGAKFSKTSMTAAEAQMHESWNRSVEEAARIFRIPPYKVMHYGNAKYDNLASMAQMYAEDSLIPTVKILEDRLNWCLLTEKEIRQGLYVEFDRDALYATDAETRHKRSLEAWKVGTITRNQYLEETGRNPSKNGDVYVMPANTFLIDEDNQVVVTNQASPGDPGAHGGGDKPPPNNDTGDEAGANA